MRGCLYFLVRPGKLALAGIPAHITLYPIASNFIVAVVDHVHTTYLDVEKVGYHFTVQKMYLAVQ